MPQNREQPEIIDGRAVKGLVEARALRGATIVGQPGGWSVVVRYGSVERAVAAQRARRARLWRNLNTAANYVREELGLPRFDVDSANHEPDAIERRRPDTADRQRRARAAVEHDTWFRGEVEGSLVKADSAEASWLSHETVMGKLDNRIARLRKRAETGL